MPDSPQDKQNFSVRVKFVLALLSISILPLAFVVLFIVSEYSSIIQVVVSGIGDSDARQALVQQEASLFLNLSVLVGILLLLIGVMIGFFERFFVGGTGALLAWIRGARLKKFTDVPPVPVTSSDELGRLGEEMGDAIKEFRELEEREKHIVEEKMEFITVGAHQLRTPLNILRWGLEGLLDEKKSAAERKKLGEQISESVKQTIALVDDLLNVQSIEEGKFGYHFQNVALVPVLKKLVDEFNSLVEGHTLTLALKVDPEVSSVFADPEKIVLAVSNLLTNAIEYTPAGGHITLALVSLPTKVEISVTDTGIGMSENMKKHLFTKFSRGEEARKMHPNGSGLGLYVARNIVLKHGSDIKIVSEAGKGSTFSFTLPKEKPDSLNPEVSIQNFFAGNEP